MVIVVARPAHLEAVEACVDVSYRGYIGRIGRAPAPMLDDYEQLIDRGVVRLAIEDEQVVGLIVLWDAGDHLYVDNIAVAPSAQGRGVGSQLLAEADRLARDAGRGEIRLHTNAAMTESLAYYAGQGFTETHRGRADGFHRVHLARPVG